MKKGKRFEESLCVSVRACVCVRVCGLRRG